MNDGVAPSTLSRRLTYSKQTFYFKQKRKRCQLRDLLPFRDFDYLIRPRKMLVSIAHNEQRQAQESGNGVLVHHVTQKIEDDSHNTIPFARPRAGGISFKRLQSNCCANTRESQIYPLDVPISWSLTRYLPRPQNSKPVITTSCTVTSTRLLNRSKINLRP